MVTSAERDVGAGSWVSGVLAEGGGVKGRDCEEQERERGGRGRTKRKVWSGEEEEERSGRKGRT